MLAAVLANPLRPGACYDGDMLRRGQQNRGDGFGYRGLPRGDGNPCPVRARIDGMKERSPSAGGPNIIPRRGNCLEIHIVSNGDWLKRFSPVG